ncbi:MAG: potassium-transporting ATPase subunit KdpA, partial [Lachnospiraceae bacterium]
MLQIVLTLVIFMILVIPMGTYMYHIATKQKTFADPVLNQVDNAIYKVCHINRTGMNWKQYTLSLILTNAVMVMVGYFILRVQGVLLGNPNGIGAMEASLSYNTIVSFMTNTNLQHYSGESGLSYLSQMLVIIFMMFTSAASGYAACMAFCRGLAGKTKDVGNFYEDMLRITTRILIPIAFLVGLLLVSQGVPQTLQGNQTIHTIEGTFQDLAMGPVAALESIKHLGTNG